MSRFAIVSREELWIEGRLFERRLTHGEAIQEGNVITAVDSCDVRLLEACDETMERLRRHRPDFARVRLVGEARLDGTSATITVRVGHLSIVSRPESIEHDLQLLRELASTTPDQQVDRSLPLVWRNGSAAVLFHEAVGHASEHGHPPLQWPEWLAVEDSGADLLAGEAPSMLRRASFRDRPMPRMNELVVTQSGGAFDMPEACTEILLVDGGAYEPLTGEVTIRIVAADHVAGGNRRRLRPFEIRCARQAVAASLVGARGLPIRYPGVICSREGQELVVGSHAPVMLTTFP